MAKIQKWPNDVTYPLHEYHLKQISQYIHLIAQYRHIPGICSRIQNRSLLNGFCGVNTFVSRIIHWLLYVPELCCRKYVTHSGAVFAKREAMTDRIHVGTLQYIWEPNSNIQEYEKKIQKWFTCDSTLIQIEFSADSANGCNVSIPLRGHKIPQWRVQ